MKKRVLAVWVAVCMGMSLLPATVLAAESADYSSGEAIAEAKEKHQQEENADFWYVGANEANDALYAYLTKNGESETYTLTVFGEGAMVDYTVGGAPWHTKLGSKNRNQINAICLESGLTHIGNNAFLQASVTKVTIPDTVISIGTNAFWNCNTIQTTLPVSVQKLDVTAFFGTFDVKVADDSPYFCNEGNGKILYSKDKTTLYQVSQDYSGAFTIPETVTSIYDYAMYGCAQVDGALTIPDSVQSIGQSAFYGTGFTSLTLGSNVKEIGKWAFQNCSKMKGNLVLPESVTSIGEYAFNGTGFDETLTFNAQIEEIPNNEFTGSAFTSVTLSGGVKKIGTGAFQNCKKLESVAFSDNVESIGDSAFNGCTALTSVTFGQGLQTIGASAFAKSGLSGELRFPDSLKEIKVYAFSECDKITKIIIPEGSIAIEYAAFYKDTGVQQINIPLSETTFDKLAHEGYYIFTWGGSTLNTLAIGAVPEEVSISQLFANSTSGLKTLILGTGVSANSTIVNPPTLENGLYPDTLPVTGKLSEVGTKYTVSDGKLEKNSQISMLTFETPDSHTKPNITYLSSDTDVVTVNEDGLMTVVGSIGQTATVKAQYDDTTFAKVDVTVGAAVAGDFYSIDPVIADQTYTGSKLTPTIKVTKNDTEITEGFTVEYSDNTNVGTATATVKVGNTVIGTATFKIVKATPTISITADKTALTGSGTVILTVAGIPDEGTVKVTCDVDGINVVDNGDGTFTVTLPNETKTYMFTAAYTAAENGNYTDANPATCTVVVTRRSSSSGSSSGSSSNSVTVSSTKNGDVTVSPKTAKRGDTVTVTVTPDKGHELGKLTVTDKDGKAVSLTSKGSGKYTFVMPASKVTITASFQPTDWTLAYRDCQKDETCPIYPFTDARPTDWYHDGVQFCLENKLMVGYGNDAFWPNAGTTRAMIIVMLWRLNGSPVVNYALGFEDVQPDAWYTEAIRWAASEGIAQGYGNGKFGPNDVMTREQMVTILWRYAQYKDYDVSVGENTNILSYADAENVAVYAIPAMQWACGSGMVAGKAQGGSMVLDPQGSTTRAQMATMMMRFCAEIVK